MSIHVPHRLQITVLSQFSNDDAAGDYRQIRGQRTTSPKRPQRRHVPQQQFSESVSAKIFDIVGVEFEAMSLRGVLNYLNNQACESIDKKPPCTTLASLVDYPNEPNNQKTSRQTQDA
jgi:hypothetical protein